MLMRKWVGQFAGVLTVLLSVVALARMAEATDCTCRPGFNADSSLEGGTCTRTQDDGNWCEMVWNGGTKSGAAASRSGAPGASNGWGVNEANDAFLQTLKDQKIALPPQVGGPAILGDGGLPPSRFAASTLNNTDPLKYSTDTVSTFGLLMGAAIMQFAPDRSRLAIELFNFTAILPLLQDRKGDWFVLPSGAEGYASLGCVEVFEDDFRALVKTPFSDKVWSCED